MQIRDEKIMSQIKDILWGKKLLDCLGLQAAV